MPITTVAVTCTAARPDGSLIAGGKFRFLLSNTDTENGLVVPREISATANASGVAVANLWPNSLGALGTQYRVLLTDPLGSTIDLGSCTVPNSACNLHSILGLGTAPTLDQATVAKLAAQTAAAASSASATQSASSATQAATSATAAAGSATAAANSATTAAGSVTSAANSATAAGNSATSAASSNTAAGASAISAALSAADALSSKNAAATSATNSASSATSAQTSATNAATSATTATTKASEAATSATNAATSEAAALASKNAAATSETNAQGSATTAATQASNAASSATNAASSATNAASFATAAASSAAAVAAVTTGNMSSQNANSVAITGGAISGTSITVKDNVFTLQDDVDPTKQAQFQLSGLATGTTYVYTLPTSGGGASTLVDLNSAQTISASKIFSGTANVFGSSSNTGSVSVATGATTTGNTKTVNIGTNGLSGSTTNITVGSANGSTTTMLGSTVIGGAAGNQSLQVNNVVGAVDYLQVLGNSGGFPSLSAQGASANVAIVYGTKGTGAHNFTTSASQFNQFVVNHTASAVNQLNVSGSTTGAPLILSAQGSDTNINLAYAPKGTGRHTFFSNSGTQFVVGNTATAVNYAQIDGGTTGGSPVYYAQGADANINLAFGTKGTGQYFFNTGGGLQLAIGNASSAVNYFQLNGSATGGSANMSAQGADANVGLGYFTKNNGFHFFYAAGVAQAAIAPTASAVNYLNLTGAATGAAPTISAQGSDANINLNLTPKGVNGAVNLQPNGALTLVVGQSGTGVGNNIAIYPTTNTMNWVLRGTDTNIGYTLQTKGTGNFYYVTGGGQQAVIADTQSAVNYLGITGSITGAAPSIYVAGSDTNINLKLTPKGTGVLQFGTYTAGVLTPTGYITITDAGGTSRRLLVG